MPSKMKSLEEIKKETMNASIYHDWVFGITNKLKLLNLYDILKSQSRTLNLNDPDFEPVTIENVEQVPRMREEDMPANPTAYKRWESLRNDHIRMYKQFKEEKAKANQLLGALTESLPATEVNRVMFSDSGGQIWDVLHTFWLKKSSVNFNMATSRLKELEFKEGDTDLLGHINNFKIRMDAVNAVALENSNIHISIFVLWFLDSFKITSQQLDLLILGYKGREDFDSIPNLFTEVTNKIMHWWNNTEEERSKIQTDPAEVYGIEAKLKEKCSIRNHGGHTNEECYYRNKQKYEKKEIPSKSLKRPRDEDDQRTPHKRTTSEINNGNCIKCQKKYYRFHDCKPEDRKSNQENVCVQCNQKGYTREHRCDPAVFNAFRNGSMKTTERQVNYVYDKDEIEKSSFLIESNLELDLELNMNQENENDEQTGRTVFRGMNQDEYNLQVHSNYQVNDQEVQQQHNSTILNSTMTLDLRSIIQSQRNQLNVTIGQEEERRFIHLGPAVEFEGSDLDVEPPDPPIPIKRRPGRMSTGGRAKRFNTSKYPNQDKEEILKVYHEHRGNWSGVYHVNKSAPRICEVSYSGQCYSRTRYK